MEDFALRLNSTTLLFGKAKLIDSSDDAELYDFRANAIQRDGAAYVEHRADPVPMTDDDRDEFGGRYLVLEDHDLEYSETMPFPKGQVQTMEYTGYLWSEYYKKVVTAAEVRTRRLTLANVHEVLGIERLATAIHSLGGS